MKVADSNHRPGAAGSGSAKPMGFWGFTELLANVPLGERTLRDLIKRGLIPCVRLPGGRRLIFHPESVQRSLLRWQKGGVEA